MVMATADGDCMPRTRVHHLVQGWATRCPDAPAVTYKDATYSYAALWSGIESFAATLGGLGLRRGDRVGVYLEKRFETVAAIFATSLAGGVFVPINPVLRERQVGHIIADCDIRVLVTTPDRLAGLDAVLDGATSVEYVIVVGNGGGLRERATTRPIVQCWGEVADDPANVDAGVVAGVATRGVDGDVAAILYTSGSTGSPKGVVLSHRNLLAGAESVSGYLHNRSSDVILAALPISFDAGFSQLTTAFSVGAQVVLINFLLPADVVRACARHRVTGLTCVPPLWIQLAARSWPEEAVSSLRYFANTGGRLPKATLEALRSQFPCARPYLMYGLTEAFRSTYLDPDEVDARPGSIGRAIPNAEILVVRPDGSLCDPGEEGELVHRGPLVALGYWNDFERTAQRFRPVPNAPAWRSPELAVWSGDTVVSDDAGYLYFVGRRDDMIKTSGYRVSPTEIEEAAYDSGLVRDAVALGVEDEALGQRIVLVVTSPLAHELDVEQLHASLRAVLPLYMIPAAIEVRAVIPASPNGKFDRGALRSELEATHRSDLGVDA
jgi:acyl-CoA ligase (AMP-forming) (exosortase A-associated)